MYDSVCTNRQDRPSLWTRRTFERGYNNYVTTRCHKARVHLYHRKRSQQHRQGNYL